MARIFCVTSAMAGPLYGGVELARRLARAGHRVSYASFAEARATVELNGLDFVPLEPSGYEDFLAADRGAGLLRRVRNLGARRRRALESLALGSLTASLRRAKPDLILIDGEMHEQVIAASASGVRIALLNCFVSIWRRPGLPPPHHLARPGIGWRGSRLGSWLLWWALRVRKRGRAWRQRLGRAGCDRLSLLDQLAREHGFDLGLETDDSQWLIPFTYRRLPVLSLHAREFEFPHEPPPRVRYVGPMQLERRGQRRLAAPERARLERIFERCRDGERSLIYAGFGSFFSTGLDLVRALVEAVGQREAWELVITLGGRLQPDELGELPPNVHAFGWLPQLEVLRRAEVAVTHGGINTIDECVLAGVPMLIYCGFETDMAGNTSRVVHHGIGIAGNRRADGPREVGERIDLLLSEPTFRSSVERLRLSYLAYAENREAERAVESLLAGRSGA